VLVLLRRRLAAAIDGDGLTGAAGVAAVRQFRDVDAQIRQIDAAAQAAAGSEDDPDDGAAEPTFDPDQL
jgi:hypothetical protein